jgi:uncharacterized protein
MVVRKTGLKSEKLNKIEMKVVSILKKRGVKKAGIFGSFARGKQKINSDIDILVKFDDSFGLFALVRLKRELEKALGRNVDLIEYNYLHPRIKKQALKEEVRII